MWFEWNGFELMIFLKEKFACQHRGESIEITAVVGQAVVSTAPGLNPHSSD